MDPRAILRPDPQGQRPSWLSLVPLSDLGDARVTSQQTAPWALRAALAPSRTQEHWALQPAGQSRGPTYRLSPEPHALGKTVSKVSEWRTSHEVGEPLDVGKTQVGLGVRILIVIYS